MIKRNSFTIITNLDNKIKIAHPPDENAKTTDFSYF